MVVFPLVRCPSMPPESHLWDIAFFFQPMAEVSGMASGTGKNKFEITLH